MAIASSKSSRFAVVVIMCLLIPTKCRENIHKQVLVFVLGDSLFDPGNNNYINTTTAFQANYTPYGESYFNPPTGRFSNGRIIPDFIAMAIASSKSSRFAVVVIMCLLIPTKCRENIHKQVLVFVLGDSLFDPGNNNYINTTTAFQANYTPYGESYFNPPTGRFSNGRIIPDFIAEYAGLPLIPAYLEPWNNEFTHGANFASAGAGALIETFAGFVVDLQTQLRYFGDLEDHYRQNLGDTKARQLLSSAVYLFSSGANDYLSPVGNNISIYYPYTHEQYTDMVIGNLTNVIKGIYDKGGRKFGFLNVALLGCFPAIRVGQPGNTCNKEMDDIVRLHNQKLSKKLQHLEKQLEGFMYANFDISTAMYNRMNNPSKYGFKVGDTACCGSGPFKGIFSCGGKRGITDYELCDDVTEFFLFDSSHPTELAYRQFAEMFWEGDYMVTAPYNLQALFEAMTVASSNSGFIVIIVLCLSIPTGSQAHFNKHTALFVFGDSLFDAGNNNFIKTIPVFQANFLPYGESYPIPPTGRFSNGRLIPDFIAEYARLPPIPPYLAPGNTELTYGTNFASTGSGALIDTDAGFVCIHPFSCYLTKFIVDD
ncbi:SGNH hydrolase-type esterase domain-containing protein [Artemisia annua]|uniref:SGNH hydrolase-type esterase domain-containing protein n=1 Tax=Artemisia annua TaxID=35608 RepID=A0A2U1NX41_ARTAN|nr:SGNH hydrolase-type esterase domain-containing protein [Artemisia annua]